MENIMADEAEALELDTPIEGEEPVIEEGAEQQSEPFTIEIDGEEADDETPLVKQLRQEIRARDRQLAEAKPGALETPIVVGEKPTLESCEYDEDKYDSEFTAWTERKAAAAEQASKSEKVQQEANHV